MKNKCLFAENLVKLRRNSNISQIKLSEDLEISRSTLAGLETNINLPSYKLLIAIADYFNVSIDWLVGRIYGNKKAFEENNWKLSENLVKLRKEANISQMKLSKDLGIACSTLACLETGRSFPRHKLLIAIADYFNVSIDWLVGRTEHNEVKK